MHSMRMDYLHRDLRLSPATFAGRERRRGLAKPVDTGLTSVASRIKIYRKLLCGCNIQPDGAKQEGGTDAYWNLYTPHSHY